MQGLGFAGDQTLSLVLQPVAALGPGAWAAPCHGMCCKWTRLACTWHALWFRAPALPWRTAIEGTGGALRRWACWASSAVAPLLPRESLAALLPWFPSRL